MIGCVRWFLDCIYIVMLNIYNSWLYILREAMGCILCLIAVYVIVIQFLAPALRDDARTYHVTCKCKETIAYIDS
jgi:hypothetical protein